MGAIVTHVLLSCRVTKRVRYGAIVTHVLLSCRVTKRVRYGGYSHTCNVVM